jgi:DNA-directed RNA polymerase specialized sigma subunit
MIDPADYIPRLARVSKELDTALACRDRLIIQARQDGISAVAIGEAVGLSRARIYQILTKH